MSWSWSRVSLWRTRSRIAWKWGRFVPCRQRRYRSQMWITVTFPPCSRFRSSRDQSCLPFWSRLWRTRRTRVRPPFFSFVFFLYKAWRVGLFMQWILPRTSFPFRAMSFLGDWIRLSRSWSWSRFLPPIKSFFALFPWARSTLPRSGSTISFRCLSRTRIFTTCMSFWISR